MAQMDGHFADYRGNGGTMFPGAKDTTLSQSMNLFFQICIKELCQCTCIFIANEYAMELQWHRMIVVLSDCGMELIWYWMSDVELIWYGITVV